ncbi:DUF2161 domain-containing phosphodiesterase [Cohnella kolymensis]|uniref:DUF2161 domain-containing phosphodiesterase n=1 Tax=Cohnella kolymensis TaxID=1590652 RepID=UPI0009E35069|nr:DUF2161 family putative PD-(D/E)XK-type phosphodiesterase [Cohnella kolymensis]
MAVKLETELYPPLKAFFTGRGYEVKAEIRGCDLVAYRADEVLPVIVEIKKIFTLPLLLQGVDRQKTGASVWLAVERNRAKRGAHNQRFNELTALCRRLNLGFLTVTFYQTKPAVVDVWCEPQGTLPSSSAAVSGKAAESPEPYIAASAARGPRQKKRAARLQQEFNARSGDYNLGGSTKTKLVTGYREKAIQCALALACHGPSAPRMVREWTGCPNPAALLRINYYGWFKRIGTGLYELTPEGAEALLEFSEVTAVWAAKFPWAAEWQHAAQRSGGEQTK